MTTPAQQIVAKCGGAAVVAAWLGVNHSTVYRWTQPKDRGGTGGFIPYRHHVALIRAARAAGKHIEPAEFLPNHE